MKNLFKNIGWFLFDPFKHYRNERDRLNKLQDELTESHEKIMTIFVKIREAVGEKDWRKYGWFREELIEERNKYEEIRKKNWE